MGLRGVGQSPALPEVGGEVSIIRLRLYFHIILDATY